MKSVSLLSVNNGREKDLVACGVASKEEEKKEKEN